MVGKGYNIGRQFEYDVRDYLQDRGWLVKRAYASKGMFDLLAYKDDVKLGIQAKCLKSNKNRAYLSPKENLELCEYAISPTEDYEFIQWEKKYHSAVLRILQEQFTVVHAYNKFPGIQFRQCDDTGVWFDRNF